MSIKNGKRFDGATLSKRLRCAVKALAMLNTRAS